MEKFEKAVDVLKEKFAKDIIECNIPRSKRAYILLKPEKHKDAISLLINYDEKILLSTITGIDLGNEIELNYHMACNGVITLKNRIPIEKPFTKTITDIVPGANLYEREVFDLLGVVFEGHPDLKRLMLPESWPKGNYPLRKNWK